MEPTGSPLSPQESPSQTGQTPPPRAFTQGVGTVFQVGGAGMFLLMMAVCCGSGLLSKDTATRVDLEQIGWHVPWPGWPMYSAQRAMSVALTVAIGLGVAAASFGLGMQAQRRRAPVGAVIVSAIGVIFFLYHAVFFAVVMKSIVLTLVCVLLLAIYGAMLALAIGAWREMRTNPPPADLTILPAGYKIPYSHMHEESPEVRYAAEMEQRRQRLAVQQKELEAMEERIRNNRYKRGES